MNYTVDADGKKHFESWKAPGEPWVRYYGVPCQVDINKKEEYKDYFDPNNELFYLLSKDGAKKTYTPIAYRNTENIKGLLIYTFPDVPDVAPYRIKKNTAGTDCTSLQVKPTSCWRNSNYWVPICR